MKAPVLALLSCEL